MRATLTRVWLITYPDGAVPRGVLDEGALSGARQPEDENPMVIVIGVVRRLGGPKGCEYGAGLCNGACVSCETQVVQVVT